MEAGSSLAGLLPIIASIGGVLLLMIICVIVFVVVTACHTCRHSSKRVISSKNGLATLGEGTNSTSSMVRNPNYNVTWKGGDHCFVENTFVMGNGSVSISPPKSTSNVSSPNLYTAEETHPSNHVYSIATPPQPSDDTYSRLQWSISSIQKQPPPQAPPQDPVPSPHNEKIPMRRMGSITASVTSEPPFDAEDYPLSLNTSTVTALSAIPPMSPDHIPTSNLYGRSTTLPVKMAVPISPDRTKAFMVGSLQSVPENASVPVYATPTPRGAEATPISSIAPTPYLTPSMHSILTVHEHVAPKSSPVQYEELPPDTGNRSQSWYDDDHVANVAVSSPNVLLASSLSHPGRPRREIQPYATICNSAIPLSEPSESGSLSKNVTNQPPASTSGVEDASFLTASSLV